MVSILPKSTSDRQLVEIQDYHYTMTLRFLTSATLHLNDGIAIELADQGIVASGFSLPILSIS